MMNVVYQCVNDRLCYCKGTTFFAKKQLFYHLYVGIIVLCIGIICYFIVKKEVLFFSIFLIFMPFIKIYF